MSELLEVDRSLTPAAKAIATELEETGKKVVIKINRAIQIAGMHRVMQWVHQAKEAHGTLKVESGKRLRTLGGCFFYLMREELGDAFNKVQKPLKPWIPKEKPVSEPQPQPCRGY